MKSRNFLNILLIIMLSACGSMDFKNQMSKLDDTLTKYGTALRWAQIRDAASYHIKRNEEQVVVDLVHMEKFNITSVDVLEKTPNQDGTEASILIEISYYSKDRGTLQKVRQAQLWWYNQKAKHWLIDSDFPEFK
ncbi:MAG: hypothetical protein V3U02_03095 [Calditrichia bacterium]